MVFPPPPKTPNFMLGLAVHPPKWIKNGGRMIYNFDPVKDPTQVYSQPPAEPKTPNFMLGLVVHPPGFVENGGKMIWTFDPVKDPTHVYSQPESAVPSGPRYSQATLDSTRICDSQRKLVLRGLSGQDTHSKAWSIDRPFKSHHATPRLERPKPDATPSPSHLRSRRMSLNPVAPTVTFPPRPSSSSRARPSRGSVISRGNQQRPASAVSFRTDPRAKLPKTKKKPGRRPSSSAPLRFSASKSSHTPSANYFVSSSESFQNLSKQPPVFNAPRSHCYAHPKGASRCTACLMSGLPERCIFSRNQKLRDLELLLVREKPLGKASPPEDGVFALNGKPLDMDLDRICKFFIAHHRAGTGEFTRAGLSDILRRNGKPSKVASAMSREFFKVYDTDREGFLTFDIFLQECVRIEFFRAMQALFQRHAPGSGRQTQQMVDKDVLLATLRPRIGGERAQRLTSFCFGLDRSSTGVLSSEELSLAFLVYDRTVFEKRRVLTGQRRKLREQGILRQSRLFQSIGNPRRHQTVVIHDLIDPTALQLPTD